MPPSGRNRRPKNSVQRPPDTNSFDFSICSLWDQFIAAAYNSVMIDLLTFAAGLALLLGGGRSLVTGAVDVATRLKAPPLLIGLTLVAWGTSCPELAFNLAAAIDGKPGLVYGNTIGANICNLGLVIGISALVSPLLVHAQIVRREIPLMVAMFVLLLAAAAVPDFANAAGGRLKPLILLGAFAGYSAYVIREGLRARRENQRLADQMAQAEGLTASKDAVARPLWLVIVMIAGGLALLIVGGTLASGAASAMALKLGMSERVVGLTIVSVGTTLPELITSIMAVRQKQTDLAIGNAVGSCLFNIGAILALCGIIAPTPIPDGVLPSIVTMCVMGALLIPMSRTFNGKIARIEGVVLILLQAAFVVFELSRPPNETPADDTTPPPAERERQ
jgi:cation:H+ antiporter